LGFKVTEVIKVIEVLAVIALIRLVNGQWAMLNGQWSMVNLIFLLGESRILPASFKFK